MALPIGATPVSLMITADELARRLQKGESPLMIDVREPYEFSSGHIPGARNLPLSNFAASYRQLPQEQELVLVCRSDNRSGMAQRFLLNQGYGRTRNLVDGMVGWNGPVART